ncbi:MAG: hypothetical protein V2I40_01900 [Desulfobacteraceae bacterium]|nr:hypothetical protein [Desulfobacteraceae bacterium]
MTELILVGLSAGFLAFLTLFIISFFTLGVITGVIHLAALVYRSLVFGKTADYGEQAA